MDTTTYGVLNSKINSLTETIGETVTEETDAWLAENIAQETGYALDRTLAMQNAAAPADLVGDLKTAVGADVLVSQLPRKTGFINSTGKWNNTTNDGYKHIVIPISGGESFVVKTNATYGLYYACVRTYPETLTDNADVDFSTESGWTSRQSEGANTTIKGKLPTDGRYFVIVVLNNNKNTTPQSIVINGFDYTSETLADALVSYINLRSSEIYEETIIDEINLFSVDGVEAPIKWELGTVNGSTIGQQVVDYATTTKKRSVGTYIFNEPIDITCNSSYWYQVWLLDNNMKLSALAFDTYSSNPFTIPAKTYFRIAGGKQDNSDMTDIDITTYLHVRFTRFKELAYHDNGVRWCAMGDSITQGYYSYFDNGVGTSAVDSSLTWVKKVSDINKWNVNNIAVGGTGFLNVGSSPETVGYMLARSTDYSGYNLVTLSYGINDWKGNEQLGQLTDDGSADTCTTVLQAMKATIEAIMASNPNCKIIVITPMNCAGYEKNYGSKQTNYGIGYQFSNTGTLETFVQAMISVCDYYGIQYIDMTHYSPVNRENLLTALPDGVHPSLDIHTLMAYELSKKITF